ncbi:MAG: hypothetical protein JSW55_12495 [Chloroflexota bacterium]|nr:MAG: hypothetical protein JSW55_12495 [Chloroflexota bacterium]
MMHHPYVLEKLEHERRNDLLREADAYRQLRQAARGRSMRANLLKRIASVIEGLLIGPDGQLTKQDSRLTDKALTGGYR